jgi:hypothetical protein
MRHVVVAAATLRRSAAGARGTSARNATCAAAVHARPLNTVTDASASAAAVAAGAGSAHTPAKSCIDRSLYDTSHFTGNNFELFDYLQGGLRPLVQLSPLWFAGFTGGCNCLFQQQQHLYYNVCACACVQCSLSIAVVVCPWWWWSWCVVVVVVVHHPVYTEVISLDEEAQLVHELNPSLKQKKYQGGHWDRAISGFRETERFRSASCLLLLSVVGVLRAIMTTR